MTTGADNGLRRTAWRIGIQTAVLLMVSLLVVSAVVYVTVVRSQNEEVTDTLDLAMTQVKDNGDVDRDHDHDSGRPTASIRVATLSSTGAVVTTDTPAGLPDRTVMDQVLRTGQQDRRTERVKTGRYALLTQKHGDLVIQVIYSLFGQHQERERILGALGLASGVGVVLSTLLAAWLARRAVRPMSQALTLQRRFVADAGHELRTPLTLLSTRAQLLRRRLAQSVTSGAPGPGDPDPQIIEDLDGIVADTRTLAAILEELLLAADTRTPLPDELVDLTALTAEAVAAAGATAGQRSLTLAFHSDVPAATTAGTAAGLTRVVMALIDNALSHAASRVEVEISQPTRKKIAVRVADDGPGIADDVLPTMFERFAGGRRDGPDDTRHYGLGLALVSEIVSRHGGAVEATNRPAPEHGATLTVTLPTRGTGPAA